MVMLNMKNQILFAFHKALLQLAKSINFSQPISKNTKPQFQYRGFALFKSKSRFNLSLKFASFWLKYAISGLK